MLDKAMRGRASRVLEPRDVIRIREMLDSGVRQYLVAQEFGVSQSTVYDIRVKKHWGHLSS